MSGKLMGKVWELELPRDERWVLLALADHANDQGENVYPGIGYVAWKTDYSDRQVQRIFAKLEGKGILVKVAEKWGLPTIYRLDLSKAKSKPEYQHRRRYGKRASRRLGADILSPHGSDISGEKVGHSAARGSDILKEGADMSAVEDVEDKEHKKATVMEPLRHESKQPAHTRTRAQETRSQFDLHTCERYARTLTTLHTPDAFAEKIRWSGEHDDKIATWLAAERRRNEGELAHRREMPGSPSPELLGSILKAVEARVNRDSFDTWFAPIELITVDVKLVRLGVCEGAARWIGTNYNDVLSEAIEEAYPGYQLELWVMGQQVEAKAAFGSRAVRGI